MQIIWLNPRFEDELRWDRNPEESPPTCYVDGDGFNLISIVAVEDGMADRVVATVLFAGTPVLLVSSYDNWTYESPMYADDRGPDAQAYVAFLTQIGEAGEEAGEWVVENGINDLWETEYVGDGHELTAFVNEIALAVHAAYPDTTPTPST
jgi:hypothetical protein